MACFDLGSTIFRKGHRLYWMEMFDTSNADCVSKRILGQKDTLPGLIDVVAELIRNHKKSSVKQLVRAEKWPQERHEQPLSVQSVRSFLFKIFDVAVPLRLCGNVKNKRVIKMFVGKLPTKGRYETINIAHVLGKIDLVAVEWMQCIFDMEKKRELFNKVILWLVQSYICGALQCAFFVVKTTYNHKLQYYWKSTWKELSRKAFDKLEKTGKFVRVPEVDKIMWEAEGGKMLCFRAKKVGIRPIMLRSNNLKHKIVPDYVTRIAHKFLCAIYWKIISQTPFVNGYNFLQKWTEKYPYWRDKRVHFVKMDVKDAFGSVNNALMKCIIKMHFLKHVKPDQMIAVKTLKNVSNKPRVLFDIFDEDFSSFDVPVQNYKAELLFGVIVKSFECCIFQWKKFYYKMHSGLPQGNVLSAVLCNLYLHTMDQKYLSKFVAEDTLLVREVDDYLFITPSLDQAAGFYHFMNRGIAEFHVKVNFKTETSETHHFLSFLKYVINTEELEIGYDYSKYTCGDVAHWLALKCTTQQQSYIRTRMRTTCVLSDTLINAPFNSPQTALKLLFQCAYLQASRMHIMMNRLLLPSFRNDLIMRCCNMCVKVIERKAMQRFKKENVGNYVTLRAFYEKCKQFELYQAACKKINRIVKKLQYAIDEFAHEIEYMIQDLMWRTDGEPLKKQHFLLEP